MSIKFKKAELVKAANELNEILDPPIDTKLKVAELEKEIWAASAVVTEDDDLTEATDEVINKLMEKYGSDEEENDEEENDEEEMDDEDIDFDDDEEEDVDEEEEEDWDGEEDEATFDRDEEDENEEEGDYNGEEESDLEDEDENEHNEEYVDEEEEEEEEEEPAPKPKKPASKKKPKIKTVHPKVRRSKTSARIEYFIELINEGRYTRKDLVELAIKRFPEASISALQTILSDGKNPKYCRFPVLLWTDDKDGGIVKFTDKPSTHGAKKK